MSYKKIILLCILSLLCVNVSYAIISANIGVNSQINNVNETLNALNIREAANNITQSLEIQAVNNSIDNSTIVRTYGNQSILGVKTFNSMVHFLAGINATFGDAKFLNISLTLFDAGNVAQVNISAIGDSYFNGGNVGIGTSTPQNNLVIANNGAVGLTLDGADASNKAIDFASMGVLGWRLFEHSDDDFRLNRYNTLGVFQGVPLAVLRSNGNVGMGTSSPTALLDVATDGLTASNGFIVSNGDNGNKLGSINEISSDEGGFQLFTGNSETIRLRGGSFNSFFNTGGNFGIGTSSPVETLEVVGDIGIDGGVLRFKDTGGNYDGVLQYASNNLLIGQSIATGNHIQFRTGAIERARVDSGGLDVVSNITAGGNVGIGNTAPASALEISTLANPDDTIRMSFSGGTGRYNYIRSRFNGGSDNLNQMAFAVTDAVSPFTRTEVLTLYGSGDASFSNDVNVSGRIYIPADEKICFGGSGYIHYNSSSSSMEIVNAQC